jgi:hypothetical protein
MMVIPSVPAFPAKLAFTISVSDLQDFKEGMYSQLEQYHAKLEKKLNAVSSAITFVETEVLALDKKISELFNCEQMVDPREEVFEEEQEEKVPDEDEFFSKSSKNTVNMPTTPQWNRGRFVKNPNKRYGPNLSMYVQNSVCGSSSGGSEQGNGLTDGSVSAKEEGESARDSDVPNSANDLARSSPKKVSDHGTPRKDPSGFPVETSVNSPEMDSGDTEPETVIHSGNLEPQEANSRPSSDEGSYQETKAKDDHAVEFLPPRKPERHLYGGPFDNPVFDTEDELL